MELLENIEINPTVEAKSAVIWLHGLGADGHDFEPIVPELNLPEDSSIRFIFPHAPVRSVTINDGAEMRAWYDFAPHSETAGTSDIAESTKQLEQFIHREIERGIQEQSSEHHQQLSGNSVSSLLSRLCLCGTLQLLTTA